MKQMRRAMQPYVYFLYEITFESKAENVLELGSRQMQSGRTFLSALSDNKKGILTAVDLGDRSDRITDELMPYLRMVVGNTHDEKTLNKVNDREYNILFIDAGHSYEDVKKDYKMYSPLVKDGGFIILHDVVNENCGVPRFWAELDIKNKVTLPYGVAGLGIIRK